MTSYTTLEVQNFKGIREMKLEGLGMVNVFVGGNNVGKTSVLQALAFLFNVDRMEYENLNHAFQCAGKSSEDYTKIDLKELRQRVFGDAKKLSLNESFYKTGESKIPKTVLELSKPYKKDTLNHIKKISLNVETNPYYDSKELEIVCETYHNLKGENIYDNELLQVGLYGKSLPESEHILFTSYCPTDFKYLNKVADFLFDSIKFASKEYRQIMESLKRIEPNLENIVNKECILNKNGETIYLPFYVMGDGFNKLFFLTVVLHHVKKKSHFLLFDEIENGFHWSIQKDMWRMILTAAKDDGTQFFFTTHSYEVLESLNAVLQEMKDNGDDLKVAPKDAEGNPNTTQEPLDLACVFRLKKDETDKVTARKLMGDDLEAFIINKVEIR